jgi:hypothetical protein
MKRIFLICAVVLLFAASASAKRCPGPETYYARCKGILQQYEDGTLGLPVPPEGVCEINKSQAAKVLATCTPGQFCRVEGIVSGDCEDNCECEMINQVKLVRRK